jgi:hypothetical protein
MFRWVDGEKENKHKNELICTQLDSKEQEKCTRTKMLKQKSEK